MSKSIEKLVNSLTKEKVTELLTNLINYGLKEELNKHETLKRKEHFLNLCEENSGRLKIIYRIISRLSREDWEKVKTMLVREKV